jgi:hypothetical protein
MTHLTRLRLFTAFLLITLLAVPFIPASSFSRTVREQSSGVTGVGNISGDAAGLNP